MEIQQFRCLLSWLNHHAIYRTVRLSSWWEFRRHWSSGGWIWHPIWWSLNYLHFLQTKGGYVERLVLSFGFIGWCPSVWSPQGSCSTRKVPSCVHYNQLNKTKNSPEQSSDLKRVSIWDSQAFVENYRERNSNDRWRLSVEGWYSLLKIPC